MTAPSRSRARAVARRRPCPSGAVHRTRSRSPEQLRLQRHGAGGREIMEAQIRHLVELGRRPNVNIQVPPFDIDAHMVSGCRFTILQFS
ncbi:Scr1 family TA system antitoxin-like transcriptional regulator [Marinactinospora rubrisoli]|uniref:Scr1 family TA system antitoxin-like transcriptional regulator n=1 Tax=Marinactinospora rubrisoli TaxID=2715399 RepID=A0ABW2KPH5_9ACTN